MQPGVSRSVKLGHLNSCPCRIFLIQHLIRPSLMDHFVVLLVPFNESLASGFNQPTTAILIHPFNSRVRSSGREPAVLHAGHGALGP